MNTDVAFIADSELLRSAYAFAEAAHRGQYEQSDGRPYIEHPVAVARLLHETGFDEAVVAAGLLHDTVEDSDAEVADIRRRFGDDVAGLVEVLTEPAGIESYKARKAAHRALIRAAGPRAEAVFAADKISKASRLRAVIAARGEEQIGRRMDPGLDEKVEHYEASLALLEDGAASSPLVPRLRGELARLRASLSAPR